MAQPQFSVQHFLTCLSVHWEGTPGPKTARTLEGVGYYLRMEAGMEPPFRIEELWLYARFYRKSGATGKRRFRIVFQRINHPHPSLKQVFDLGEAPFTKPDGVIDIAWPIRPCFFKTAGLHEFRLQTKIKILLGMKWKTVATTHLSIE